MMLKKFKLSRKMVLIAICAGVTVLAVAAFLFIKGKQKDVTVYKQTQVQYGNLMKGVTEEGAVDIGTVEQIFDLDMSALQRVNTSGTENGNSGNTGNGGMGGAGGNAGMGSVIGNVSDLFGAIFDMGGYFMSSSGNDSSLTVTKVNVTVGQSVSVGDVLYELEEDSVTKLKEQLQSNVEKAKADLDAVYADQTLSRQQAKYTYESSIAYGNSLDTEYVTTITSLENDVTDAEVNLKRARESKTGYEAQLAEITEAYNNALNVLNDCVWGRDHATMDDPLAYVLACQAAQEAQSTADNLKQKKEQLERNLEQAEANVSTAEAAYNSAVRKKEQQKLSAVQTRELRKLANATAQETYDIAIAYLDDAAAEQNEIYENASAEWEEYGSHMKDNTICSAYSGIVTGVELSEGDKIRTGSVLITLYNREDVTMTVTVDEVDMENIHIGGESKINFTAYPEILFDGTVSYISDASSDSKGNVSYEVTVTLKGDVSGLFQGMTGKVTFVTDKAEEVLYVSRRAVITENETSYVDVLDDKGKIQRRKVTTGFTDGTYVEIQEGLVEGETVLIESKTGGAAQ